MKKGFRIASRIVIGVLFVLFILYAFLKQVEAENYRTQAKTLFEESNRLKSQLEANTLGPNFYYDLYLLSVGPQYFEEDYSGGFFYRALITNFEGYKMLWFEKILTDDEGFTESLDQRFKIDNEVSFGSFNVYSISDINWLDTSTLELTIGDSERYRIELNGDSTNISLLE